MSSKFNPKNNIIGLCVAGMAIEGSPNKKEINVFFDKAWNQAIDDFEKFIAAYYLSKSQYDIIDKLKWMETALHHALQINDDFVKSAFPSIYLNIANCYEKLGNSERYEIYYKLSKYCYNGPLDNGPFYHGTKANLNVGDLLLAGNNSNYDSELKMNHIYFTSNINVAGLAADLAKGNGLKRVYIIEPTGTFEDDPNVTDKKFPGNLTCSYRSEQPLRIISEISNWSKNTQEEIDEWNKKIDEANGEIIN